MRTLTGPTPGTFLKARKVFTAMKGDRSWKRCINAPTEGHEISAEGAHNWDVRWVFLGQARTQQIRISNLKESTRRNNVSYAQT